MQSYINAYEECRRRFDTHRRGEGNVTTMAEEECRRRFDTHRRGEGNVTTMAETGVMWPQAKQCQQPPEARRGKD